jgi:hypothetical protein
MGRQGDGGMSRESVASELLMVARELSAGDPRVTELDEAAKWVDHANALLGKARARFANVAHGKGDMDGLPKNDKRVRMVRDLLNDLESNSEDAYWKLKEIGTAILRNNI